MKKALFLLVTAVLFIGQAIASPVSVDQARRIGSKYAQRNAAKQVGELSLAYTQLTESGMDALYVFNFGGGFVMVAADDVAQPILAFGEDNDFDPNNIPDGLAYYLRHYARQIAYAVENNFVPEAEVKRTQIIADWLNSVGISATFYHAGLDSKTRDERQDLWMKGKVKVIAATNAFGMGIDKPDVRLVIHMDLPDSLEAYFQEAGRAGRDLKPSEAFLLVSPADIKKLQEDLTNSFPELKRIKLIYNALGNYLNIPIGAGDNMPYPLVISEFSSRYGFNVIEVFHTLKILEKEGFLLLSDSFDEPSKVMIKASRDDIYGFQVNNPTFGDLIQYMLRSMPGVMTDFVKINEETIAKKTGLPVEKVDRCGCRFLL